MSVPRLITYIASEHAQLPYKLTYIYTCTYIHIIISITAFTVHYAVAAAATLKLNLHMENLFQPEMTKNVPHLFRDSH